MHSATYHIYIDLLTGFQLGAASVPGGGGEHDVNRFPDPIYAGVSLTLQFHVYTDLSKGKVADLSGGAATLYGRPLNAPVDEVSLGTDAAPTTAGVASMTVAADAILPAWAAYPQTAFVFACVASGVSIRVYQNLRIVDTALTANEPGVSSSEVALDAFTLTGDTTITDAVGERVYFLDSTGAAFWVKLPAGSTNYGQKITLIFVAPNPVVNAVTLNPNGGTVNGAAASRTLEKIDESVELFLKATDVWIARNPDTVIL